MTITADTAGFINNERPAIIKKPNGDDFLVIFTAGGTVMGLGISGFRSGLKQINASKLELRDSTKARKAVYEAGIEMWEARKK